MLARRIVSGFLFGAVTISLQAGFPTNAYARFAGLISPTDAFQWVSSDTSGKVYILDVRTGEEWRWVGHPGPNGLATNRGTDLAYLNGGMLDGRVINIAFQIQKNDGTPDLAPNGNLDAGTTATEVNEGNYWQFLQDVEDTFDHDVVLLVMCRSGGRAEQAARLLGKQGFMTYNIEGGFEGHTNTASYPGPNTGYRNVDGWVNTILLYNNAPLPYNNETEGGYYVDYAY
jgi:rhodanese-related sulfurtransferase